jgi:site-specific DNA-methyltransferase (adenine-specific)
MTTALDEFFRNINNFQIHYQKSDGVIIGGDAEEILAKFPDRFIHCIISSPPYNIGISYQNYDDRKTYQEYLNKMQRILEHCYRILVSGGRIAINLPSMLMQHSKSRAAYIAMDYLLIMREIGFLDRDIIIWLKMPKGEMLTNSTSWGSWCSPSNPSIRDAAELILIMSKESYKLEGDKDKIDITSREFLIYSSNCWYIPIEQNNIHPAPFPKELPYRVMKLYTYSGNNIILDPFVGSGTTCLVAKENKRFFIGIDISKEYCELSAKRLGQNLLHF